MDCCVFGAKSLLQLLWLYIQLDPWWNYNQNTNNFIQDNVFLNCCLKKNRGSLRNPEYVRSGTNHIFTLYMPNFQQNHRHLFTFFTIPSCWYGTGSWHYFPWKTRSYPFYVVSIMGADALVTQGTRASVTIILILLNWENSFPHFNSLRPSNVYLRR